MRLDRDLNQTGKGKCALIKLREIPGDPRTPQELADAILANPGCVDFGIEGSDSEFFLIRLKDKHAPPALQAYAEAAQDDDPEYAAAVARMAERAQQHPAQKAPD